MKKDSVFVLIFLFVFMVVMGYRLEHYIFLRDYKIFAHIPCNPETDVCYIQIDTEEDPVDPYKVISIDANHAPDCLFENNCESFACITEETCTEILCSNENVEEGLSCSDNLVSN